MVGMAEVSTPRSAVARLHRNLAPQPSLWPARAEPVLDHARGGLRGPELSLGTSRVEADASLRLFILSQKSEKVFDQNL